MSAVLERIQYGYDRNSRRTWRRRALATGEDYHYSYDGLGQVVKSDRGALNLNCSAIAATPKHAENWNYDPTGNWHGYRVEEDGSITLEQDRHHDKGNRLTLIEGEANLFALDRVGRMTQAAPNASGDWNEPLKFKWDAWNRITEVRRAADDLVLAEYSYDGLARRVTKEAAGVVRHTYFSDRWKPLEERKDSGTSASAQYLWGARHRDDLARRDRDTDGEGTLDETRYVLMDYYSPSAVTDDEGSVTERYDFTAFGVRRIMQPNFSPNVTSECDFDVAFQGQFLDPEIGMLNYGYRYYSPHLGRWLSKDPIGSLGGLYLYAFVRNQPTNKYDLFGLLPSPPYYPKDRDKLKELCETKCGEKPRPPKREPSLPVPPPFPPEMFEPPPRSDDPTVPPKPQPPTEPSKPPTEPSKPPKKEPSLPVPPPLPPEMFEPPPRSDDPIIPPLPFPPDLETPPTPQPPANPQEPLTPVPWPPGYQPDPPRHPMIPPPRPTPRFPDPI